ncbi:hypothetical protein F4823DRAFT_629380 [Ustulina deusta]|nr:hypothetical protein F4823DRAFT_629380 [Ustulina deusta]
MAESAPILPYPSMEYNEVGVEMPRFTTLEANTNISDKTPHEGLTDIGSLGHHDGHGQDKFPIGTLWTQVLEEKQSQPPFGSTIAVNNPIQYKEYLQQEVQPDASDLIDTIYKEPSFRVRVGQHLKKERRKRNRHGQALKQSERIKARKKKSTEGP